MPTKEKLHHRGIQVPDGCGICGRNLETQWHLFLDCPFALDCWGSIGLLGRIEQQRHSIESFAEWVQPILREGPNEITEKMMVVMWPIWKERNERVWSRKSNGDDWVVQQAVELLSDWSRAQARNRTGNAVPRHAECNKWHAPLMDRVKCNVDAATFEVQRRWGLGMCVRDSSGQLLCYRMPTRRSGRPVREGEAWALLEALRWVTTVGYDRVKFESDALAVVRAVNSNIPDNTEFGDIIARCRSTLLSNPQFEVCYCCSLPC
ncbi:Putative ribonuclease H protein At1g65750 [Linum perenne]